MLRGGLGEFWPALGLMESPGWCLPYTRRSTETSALERALDETPEDIPHFVLLLKSVDVSMPVRDKPLLSWAIEQRRSPLFLKAMLENGVPVDQKDRHGRTALEALLQTNVRFVNVPGVTLRYDRRDQCRMVSFALQLLARGAIPPPIDDFTLGVGNELCARCVKEYRDALGRAVINRAVCSGKLPGWTAVIADFLT